MNGAVREPPVLRPVDETYVWHAGRRLAHFAGSDYLRLSWHPAVRRAAEVAVGVYGTGVCASRMTTGNLPLYGELERELAVFFGVATATLTSAGYTAPLVAAQALGPDHSHVILDERAHACLRDAALLTGLPWSRFGHRDAGSLRKVIRSLGRRARVLVMVDGLFTHDGQVSPVGDYLGVLPETATLLVDDSHGAGVLGARGRGTAEWCGVPPRRLVVTITLSKAFGCYGGAILGARAVREKILSRSAIFTGNTPPSPPSVAAAREALAVMQREGESRRGRLRRNVALVKAGVEAAGGRVGDGPGPMFAVAPASRAVTERLRRRLLAEGIYPPLIRYPNGPAERYFRFAISSEHTPEQLANLTRVLAASAPAWDEVRS